jgi:hypothetical protein
MSRLHVQTWGEKQTIDIKSDWALLSEDERRRKADELIAMIRELKEPRCSRRHWSIVPKRRLTSQGRAGSVGNLDRSGRRADGPRLYCGDLERRGDSEGLRAES